eukprot:COSAG05_NODE_41_length_26845_cov_26.599230_6_plen_107_part_00
MANASSSDPSPPFPFDATTFAAPPSPLLVPLVVGVVAAAHTRTRKHPHTRTHARAHTQTHARERARTHTHTNTHVDKLEEAKSKIVVVINAVEDSLVTDSGGKVVL